MHTYRHTYIGPIIINRRSSIGSSFFISNHRIECNDFV